MARRTPITAVLCLLLAVLIAPPAAAATTIDVGFEVLSATGQPTPSATVRTLSGPTWGEWYTDSDPLALEPGDYTFAVTSEGEERFTATTTVRSLTEDTTLVFRPPTRDMAVTLRNHLGQSTSATGTQYCEGGDESANGYSETSYRIQGATITDGIGTLPVLEGEGAKCTTHMTAEDGTEFQRDYAPPAGRYDIALAAPVDLDVVLDAAGANLYTSRVAVAFAGAHPFVTGARGGGEPSDDPSWRDAESQYTFRIESNPAPYTITTETSSQDDFRQVDATRAGTGMTTSTTVDLTPTYRPLHVALLDTQGQPADGIVQVKCEDAGEQSSNRVQVWYQTFVSQEMDINGLHRTDGVDACRIRALIGDAPVTRASSNLDQADGPNDVVLRAPAARTLSGTVSDGAGGTIVTGGVVATPEAVLDESDFDASDEFEETGQYSLDLEGRPVSLSVYGRSDKLDDFRVTTPLIDPTEVTTYDVTIETSPVHVQFRNADGSAATGSAWIQCEGVPEDSPFLTQSVFVERDNITGTATLWGMDGTAPTASASPEPCALHVYDGSRSTTIPLVVPDQGLDVVVYPGGRVVAGDPSAAGGEDGVPDIVEALGPNGGDGNADGVPDYQQDNVTSLPANGDGTSGDPDYVTLESPSGTTLSQVTTQPLGAADSTPPSGVDLTTGLLGFKLTGLASGTSAVVKIYSTSSATPTGYAKYHHGSWTVLPADRVSVTGTTVAVTLTDGGVGDDDGAADGAIVDPGGPAVVQTDHDPPVITMTGVSDGATYTVGNVPGAGCTATDASALAGSCTVTRSGGRSNGVGTFTATATATDVHGNTATKTVQWSVQYRVDGFLAPLNNPPASMSVFKSGSTVRLGLVLRRANGTVITPTAAPRWVAPVRGVTTRAAVNEGMAKDKPTAGTQLVHKTGTWTYVWATKGVTKGYVYRLAVVLDDGTTRTITVGVK